MRNVILHSVTLAHRTRLTPSIAETSAVAFPLRFPPLPALTSLTFGLDCDIELEESDERCQRVRNAVAVYTQLLSHHQSFPSLEIVQLSIFDPILAPYTFSSRAYQNTLWSDFARVFTKLPQIQVVNFVLLGLESEGSAVEEGIRSKLYVFLKQYMIDEEDPERSLNLYGILSSL